MTDSTEPRSAEGLKPCPNPACHGVFGGGVVRNRYDVITCHKCGTQAFRDAWQAIPRPTIDTVERVVQWPCRCGYVIKAPVPCTALPSGGGGEEKWSRHLRNAMGYLDTPIARRKLGIDANEPWLQEARAALQQEQDHD